MATSLRISKDIAFLSCLLFAVLLLLGYTTPDWTVIGDECHGLWLHCTDIHHKRQCRKLTADETSAVLQVIRVLLTPALLCEVVSVILLSAWAKQQPIGKQHYISLLGKLGVAISLLGGALCIVSALLYFFLVAEHIDFLNWSFYLVMTSGCGVCISSIASTLMVCYLNHIQSEELEQQKEEEEKKEEEKKKLESLTLPPRILSYKPSDWDKIIQDKPIKSVIKSLDHDGPRIMSCKASDWEKIIQSRSLP